MKNDEEPGNSHSYQHHFHGALVDYVFFTPLLGDDPTVTMLAVSSVYWFSCGQGINHRRASQLAARSQGNELTMSDPHRVLHDHIASCGTFLEGEYKSVARWRLSGENVLRVGAIFSAMV